MIGPGVRTNRSNPPPVIQVAAARRNQRLGTTGEDIPGYMEGDGVPPSMEFRWQAPGYYGIPSRSRFLPFDDGHNVVDAGQGIAPAVHPVHPEPDPAGLQEGTSRLVGATERAVRHEVPWWTQRYPESLGEGATRSPQAPSLGGSTVAALRGGEIAQERRSFPAQDGRGGAVLQAPIRWGFGPHATTYHQLYATVRKEWEQEAQTFLGQHTRVLPGSKYSSYPKRMVAARSSRLSVRVLPASYGSYQQVIGGGEIEDRMAGSLAGSQSGPRTIPSVSETRSAMIPGTLRGRRRVAGA